MTHPNPGPKLLAAVVVLALSATTSAHSGAQGDGGVPLPLDLDEIVCEGSLASYLCTAWAARYDGPMSANDIAYAIAIDPDGRQVYVTGYAQITEASNTGYATIAYDSVTGARNWVAHFNQGTGNDIPYAIEVSPDGSRVFVTGESRELLGNPDRHYATIAYDTTDGTELWVTNYDGAGTGNDVAHDLVVSPDGSTVFVTGQSPGDGTYNDFATVAYDAMDGTEMWVARYDGPLGGNDVAQAMGTSADGSTVFVTGYSPGVGTSLDYVTIGYDADTGVPVWTTRYNGPGNNADAAADLAVVDGSVLVTGHSVGQGTGADYATIKYSAQDGAEQWVARYNGPANGYDTGVSLDVSPNGSVAYVTGISPGNGTGQDYATVAFDVPTGAQLWAARYDGPGSGRDRAAAVGASADGSQVFVTGDSFGDDTGYGDSLTVAYDATDGTEIWTARSYDSLGLAELGNIAYDRSEALVVHPDSSLVYITGLSWSDADMSGYNWQTVAYGTVAAPSASIPSNPPALPLPDHPLIPDIPV